MRGLFSRFITILMVFIFTLSITTTSLANSFTGQTTIAKGKVISMEEYRDDQNEYMEEAGYTLISYNVEIKIVSGKFKGETVLTQHHLMDNRMYDINVKVNSQVLLEIESDGDNIINAYITDYVRDRYVYLLGAVFILLLLVIGRLKGLKTVLTLFLTLFAVFKFLIPSILKGYNPILIAILIATGVTVITILIVGGINKKSVSAILGTLGGIIFAGLLAYIAGSFASLTGLSSEEAQLLLYAPIQFDVDYRGLLFAGIIIGALGAVMDVSMSIASSMDEIRKADESISLIKLWNSGMNVGKDIMGTMSNTLILAYVGTSIPLILLVTVYGTPLMKIINLDMITTEFIRALSGSIGLILSIPITAFAYTSMSRKKTTATKE